VVGLGVVDAGGGDGEALLALPGRRVGEIDDVEDLGPPKRGGEGGEQKLLGCR
jgi:hypothetical protein